jgi:hypothetical protein
LLDPQHQATGTIRQPVHSLQAVPGKFAETSESLTDFG